MERVDDKIARIKVDSSQIESVAHDALKHLLEVEFKTGSIYVYKNVDAATVFEMVGAVSVGKFFGNVIKQYPDKYPFTKIRGPLTKEERADRDLQKKVSDGGAV